MYERHYHLKKKPFELLPDPQFFFLSAKHRRALSLLEYGLLDQAGFIVVTGQVGAGKTTLIRHLLNKKRADRGVKIAIIFNTQLPPEEFLEPVLEAYGLPYQAKSRTERLATLREFVRKEALGRNQLALIIDEAQNLPFETLEEVRLLSNMDTESRHLMQIVLVGQPALREKLCDPRMLPFAQRVTYDYHLPALDADETVEYIRHRLHVAQARDPDLFALEAMREVHKFSDGIPRLINLICHVALVYGFADKLTKIGEDVIREVVKDWEVGQHLQAHTREGLEPWNHPAEVQASPLATDSMAEIRRSVEEIRLHQDHMFRILSTLCSDTPDRDAPAWLQERKSVEEPAGEAALDHLNTWSRTRKLLQDRDLELAKCQEKIRDLQDELDRLRGRSS
ncbi:MAG: AAA family ATPase [bacterium]